MSSSGVEYYDILSGKWQKVQFKITTMSETHDLKLAVDSDLIYGVS